MKQSRNISHRCQSNSSRTASHRVILVSLLLAILFSLSSCYHYRVTAPDPLPASPMESMTMTVHSLFWGLLPGAQPHLFAKNCTISNALDEVTMTTNYGYAFVTIVTLGFWAPMDIEWRCAKTTSPDIEEEL